MDNQKGTMTLRDRIAYNASIWWLRIVVFFGAVMLVPFYFAIAFNNESEISINVTLFVVAFAHELCRKKGSIATFGFSVSKFSIREIVTATLLFIVGVIIIPIAALVLGVEVSWEHYSPFAFERYSLMDMVLRIGMLELGIIGVIFRGIEQRVGGIIAQILTSAFCLFFVKILGHHTTLGVVNYILVIFVSCTMYQLTRSLWMPIIFNGLCGWFHDSVFYVDYLETAKFLSFPNEVDKFRWLFIGQEGIVDGLGTTIVILLILAILPKITKVSPYTAAALFNQQYAESELKALYKLRN